MSLSKSLFPYFIENLCKVASGNCKDKHLLKKVMFEKLALKLKQNEFLNR